MNELKAEAVMNFNGKFYEGIHNGRRHILVINYPHFYAFSKEPLTEKSTIHTNGLYVTDFSVNELSDVFKSTLTAMYKGNEYEVGMITAGLEKIELFGRKGHFEEDKELGFDLDPNDRIVHIFLQASEIDALKVNRESIYKVIKAQQQEQREQTPGLKM